jgi:Protein of unknown function (DUF3499)
MSYEYATSTVLVEALTVRHPTRYDLCHLHAETLTAPRGWRIEVSDNAPVVPRAVNLVELEALRQAQRSAVG